MASNNRTPGELDCSNLAIEWPIWKQYFIVYMIANKKMDDDEMTKIATFIWLIGQEGSNIYNTLFPHDGSQEELLGRKVTEQIIPANGYQPQRTVQNIAQRTLDYVLKKFDEHCLQPKNLTLESYKFNTILQNEDQSFNDFETELRTQLVWCDFKCTCGKIYADRMLRDRIIIGVYDKTLQLKLLDGKDEPLQKIIDMCNEYEAAQIEISSKNDVKVKKSVSFNDWDSWNAKHKAECPTCLKNENHLTQSNSNESVETIKTAASTATPLTTKTIYSMEEIRSKGTFSFQLRRFSQLKNSIHSPSYFIRNIPWKLKLTKRTNENLGKYTFGVHLLCDGNSSYTATVELRLKSFRPDIDDLVRTLTHVFSKKTGWGYSDFELWDDIANPANGYILDDIIEISAYVNLWKQ